MTQTLIIHVIRTNKIPFLQSRASWPLMRHDGGHHGRRHVAAVLAAGRGPRVDRACRRCYWPLLVLTLLVLHAADATDQDVAAAEGVDLSLHRQPKTFRNLMRISTSMTIR